MPFVGVAESGVVVVRAVGEMPVVYLGVADVVVVFAVGKRSRGPFLDGRYICRPTRVGPTIIGWRGGEVITGGSGGR